MSPDLRLYAILDPEAAPGRNLPDLARAVAQGGATLVQLRAKRLGGRAMVEAARAIHAALKGSGVPLLVNDRADVALAAACEGVHLGQDDLAPDDARAMLGPAAIIGRSLKSEAHVRALGGEPVDYGCIGGVFATANKDNADAPVGLDGLTRLRALARRIAPAMPVGAIAGIDDTNAGGVVATGADGIAVIGALLRGDPADAARRLRIMVDLSLHDLGRHDLGRHERGLA